MGGLPAASDASWSSCRASPSRTRRGARSRSRRVVRPSTRYCSSLTSRRRVHRPHLPRSPPRYTSDLTTATRGAPLGTPCGTLQQTPQQTPRGSPRGSPQRTPQRHPEGHPEGHGNAPTSMQRDRMAAQLLSLPWLLRLLAMASFRGIEPVFVESRDLRWCRPQRGGRPPP